MGGVLLESGDPMGDGGAGADGGRGGTAEGAVVVPLQDVAVRVGHRRPGRRDAVVVVGGQVQPHHRSRRRQGARPGGGGVLGGGRAIIGAGPRRGHPQIVGRAGGEAGDGVGGRRGGVIVGVGT